MVSCRLGRAIYSPLTTGFHEIKPWRPLIAIPVEIVDVVTGTDSTLLRCLLLTLIILFPKDRVKIHSYILPILKI